MQCSIDCTLTTVPQINHVEELSHGVKTFSEDEDADHQPFPTLEAALAAIDVHTGFNIEIKWDMELKDGSRESQHAFEMNLYMDAILTTVLQHGAARRIFFSSFNPDVCTVYVVATRRRPLD